MEQRAQRVVRLAEAAIHQTQDCREITAHEGLGELASEITIDVVAKGWAHAGVDVMIAQVQRAEAEAGGFAGDFRGEFDFTHSQLGVAGGIGLQVFSFGVVAIDFCLFRYAFEQRTDGIMSADPLPVDTRGPDPLLVDLFAVTLIGQVAVRRAEPLDEAFFQRVAKKLLS